MKLEEVKKAVDKNDWKTLGRDKKGRFTPRGGEDETKKEHASPVKKVASKKYHKEEKKVAPKKTVTKKPVKKVVEKKQPVKKIHVDKEEQDEKEVNPISKKNEYGLTMCDYLKKFRK